MNPRNSATTTATDNTPSNIRLRGVAVHNLRHIDLDLPHHQLTVICGVSGSGKTTLAIDTLFAEGQRRYIESFSAYSRHFLARLPRPQADEISGIPPAVLVTQPDTFHTSHRTLGAVTEVTDYLRLAFSRLGVLYCPQCQRRIERSSPELAVQRCEQLPAGTRLLIGFSRPFPTREEWQPWVQSMLEGGFVRAIAGSQILTLADVRDFDLIPGANDTVHIVVDRVVAGSTSTTRMHEAWETAFEYGDGRAFVALQQSGAESSPQAWSMFRPQPVTIDGESWLLVSLNTALRCSDCGIDLIPPSPQLFNWNSPLGACPGCSGNAVSASERTRRQATASSESEAQVCSQCQGARLRPEALAFRFLDQSIDQISRLPIRDLLRQLRQFLSDGHANDPSSRRIVQQLCSRLEYLDTIGLGYLSLHRELMTLSRGEAQRVALTTALGSSLVQLLYVLDEPTAGLHPIDVDRVQRAIESLRDRGNTVVVVEHDEKIIMSADHVVEIGPAAGEAGGQVTFQGQPRQLCRDSNSLTGRYLSRHRVDSAVQRRSTGRGWIKLLRARGHNLQNIDVAFPLGVLAVVTGVSGSGKTSLVDGTLYPALCKRKRKKAPAALPYDEIVGDGQFDDVILVDQSPVGRTPRSNPVTYIKAFDEIRKLFAESMYARMRNLTAGHFSFNVDGGGRCTTCEGDGLLTIDMHFLPDVQVNCPDCDGKRYRPDILDIHYRGKSIFDVLNMSVREAYVFFRGQKKLQSRLQFLIDVGLEYVRLGQPANTLSAGEAQRLKLASHLGATRRSRTVFLMDEPTRGLHFHDVIKLLDCFDALLSVGHSLIVVEHDLRLLRSADYLIELGPGPAEEGGRVVVAGTPEEVANCPESPTGSFLREFGR